MDQQITTSSTPTKLLGVFELLSQAWSIYKQRIWSILGIVIIPQLIYAGMVIEFAGTFILFGDKFKFSDLTLGVILSVLLFFIITIIVSIFEQAALIYAIKDNQEKIGVMEAYKRVWNKFGSLFWVSFLSLIIVFIGFMLLIIPGIIFAIWFSFAIFIVIVEDLKGMEALKKSKEYVKGRFGAVFWRFFFISMFFIIIAIIFSFVFDFIPAILKIPFNEQNALIVDQIINFIVGLFLTPLMITYLYSLYQNLKATRGE